MTGPAGRQSIWLPEYGALLNVVGLVDLGRRTQIEVGGDDRAQYLHNLTTNEIRKLAPGAGCEAFFTSVQGKTLAHVFVFALRDSLVIDTVPGQAEPILKHLDHYLVTERVALDDRSNQWTELLLAGPQAARLLEELIGGKPPVDRLAHAPVTVAGRNLWVRRAELVGQTGYLVAGLNVDVGVARTQFLEAGALRCSAEAFEAARIEWGFPLFGVDISDRNLPQEVGRDSLAISFIKGCYLGQETVARIDALGHVNKTLAGVRFPAGDIPQPGTRLSAAGQSAGEVTSAAYSPALDAPLALAYLRRGSSAPGIQLDCDAGKAEVVSLPVR